MRRKPRDPEVPILPRSKLLWLALVGGVMAAATLGVLAWADSNYDRDVARTMGMTSFAIANLFYSFCERDERMSVFSLDVLRDRKFLMFSGASVLAIILAPQLSLLNRILQTTPLTLHQWLICIVAALAAVVVTEIRKFILRRKEKDAPPTAATAAETPPSEAPQPAAV
jgi:Ca2+-transporting ATPase